MSNFQKFKSHSYCVGGRHYSDTTNIYGFISAKSTKMLKGSWSKCKRKKSMTESDAKIEAEGIKDFSKSISKATVN